MLVERYPMTPPDITFENHQSSCLSHSCHPVPPGRERGSAAADDVQATLTMFSVMLNAFHDLIAGPIYMPSHGRKRPLWIAYGNLNLQFNVHRKSSLGDKPRMKFESWRSKGLELRDRSSRRCALCDGRATAYVGASSGEIPRRCRVPRDIYDRVGVKVGGCCRFPTSSFRWGDDTMRELAPHLPSLHMEYGKIWEEGRPFPSHQKKRTNAVC